MHEYDDIMEDILGGVEGDSFDAQGLDHALKELNLHHLEKGSDAWNKLNTFLGPGYTDDVSDSERCVVSLQMEYLTPPKYCHSRRFRL